MPTIPRHRAGQITAALCLSAAALTACGGSGSTSDASPSPNPTPGASSGPGGGINTAQFKKIQRCLKAAGLQTAGPSRPGGIPPSNLTPPPNFTPPASGIPSGGPGAGVAGALSSAKVRQALKACGITLPSASSTP